MESRITREDWIKARDEANTIIKQLQLSLEHAELMYHRAGEMIKHAK